MRESADRRARALCTHHLGEERPAVSVGELSSPVSRAPIGRLILHGIICPWHSSGAMSSVNAVTHPATPPGDYWAPELWALAASSESPSTCSDLPVVGLEPHKVRIVACNVAMLPRPSSVLLSAIPLGHASAYFEPSLVSPTAVAASSTDALG